MAQRAHWPRGDFLSWHSAERGTRVREYVGLSAYVRAWGWCGGVVVWWCACVVPRMHAWRRVCVVGLLTSLFSRACMVMTSTPSAALLHTRRLSWQPCTRHMHQPHAPAARTGTNVSATASSPSRAVPRPPMHQGQAGRAFDHTDHRVRARVRGRGRGAAGACPLLGVGGRDDLNPAVAFGLDGTKQGSGGSACR